MARVCRKPQLEQPLRLTRQVQHHHAVGGAEIERDRSPQHGAAVLGGSEPLVQFGERLVFVGMQFDLRGAGGDGQRGGVGQADLELDRGFCRIDAEIVEGGMAQVIGCERQQSDCDRGSGRMAREYRAASGIARGNTGSGRWRRRQPRRRRRAPTSARRSSCPRFRPPPGPLTRPFLPKSSSDTPQNLRRSAEGTCRALVAAGAASVQAGSCGFIVRAGRGRYSGGLRAVRGGFPMSVQMVLLPVFVLVGLTFFLLLWMAGARRGALVGGETKIRDIALGQQNWPHARHPDRQLLPQPVRTAAAVLHPDRDRAAAAPCRSRHRAAVLGVRGHALCPCRHFRDLQRSAASASLAWFAGVLVLFAMWLYFALKMLLLI